MEPSTKGRHVVKVKEWDGKTIRLALPAPKRIVPKDDINFHKIPVEVAMRPREGEDDEEIFSFAVEPQYCEHGVLCGLSVAIECQTNSLYTSFALGPPSLPEDESDGGASCGKCEEDDEGVGHEGDGEVAPS